mgnify:CR=1 FL=1
MSHWYPNGIAEFVAAARFNDAGLIPAIAQQHDSGEVLMMAWMSPETLEESMRTGTAVYWSRSRNQPWRKGESSGQTQELVDIRLDCDGDTVLLLVNQKGVACHTGRRSCFYQAVRNDRLKDILPVDASPDDLYGPRG